MRELRYTLVANGSSDTALLPILTWLLRTNGVSCAIQPEWADLRPLLPPGKHGLAERIRLSLDFFPCDLVFIHRDAEREPREKRLEEIEEAIQAAEFCAPPPAICVVPIRMQEAWLLFDEAAIRYAAGNPSGRQPLDLPAVRQLEQILDPKAILHECLRQASGLNGRRLKRFRARSSVHRITDVIDDFGPLRGLPAFAALENDVRETIRQQGWDAP